MAFWLKNNNKANIIIACWHDTQPNSQKVQKYVCLSNTALLPPSIVLWRQKINDLKEIDRREEGYWRMLLGSFKMMKYGFTSNGDQKLTLNKQSNKTFDNYGRLSRFGRYPKYSHVLQTPKKWWTAWSKRQKMSFYHSTPPPSCVSFPKHLKSIKNWA